MDWGRVAKRIRVPLGFLFAAFFLWRAQPEWWSLGIGSAIALTGVWIRAISSGHVKKNEELAVSGPYAYTRNPLYFGSIVIAAGFALGRAALGDCGGTGDPVCGNLHSGDSRRGAIFEPAFRGLQGILRACASGCCPGCAPAAKAIRASRANSIGSIGNTMPWPVRWR